VITAPGHYDGLPLVEYLADPCPAPSLNATTAHVLIERSPMHARWQHPKLNPGYVREESEHFDLGTAFHALCIEGLERFEVVDAADWKTKAAQTARGEIRARGNIPLLPPQRHRLHEMHRAVLGSGCYYSRLGGGLAVPERTLVWTEATPRAGQVWCRARPDWVESDLVVDLKTTSASAHPAEWSRTLFSTGAHLQAAMIRRAWRRLYQCEPEILFLIVETEPPYGVSLMGLDPEAQHVADTLVDGAIVTWGRCLESGDWPGYTHRVAYAELPPWLKTKYEIRSYYL